MFNHMKIDIILGFGNIAVGVGKVTRKNKEEEVTELGALLYFTECPLEYPIGDSVNPVELDSMKRIRIAFTKKESIDVVRKALDEAEKILTQGEEEHGSN